MIETSTTIGEIGKALSLAQTEMTSVTRAKTATVVGENKKGESIRYNYTYADLAGVYDAIMPALNKNGLAFIQPAFSRPDGTIIVMNMLIHGESGEWIRWPLEMKSKRDDPQGLGSVITYARRYSANGLGVAPEDDDGAMASRRDRYEEPEREVPASRQMENGLLDDKLIFPVTSAFARLHLEEKDEIAMLAVATKGRKIDGNPISPTHLQQLKMPELLELRRLLKEEGERQKEAAKTQICELCTAQPGERHYNEKPDGSGMPCPNDTSPEADRIRKAQEEIPL